MTVQTGLNLLDLPPEIIFLIFNQLRSPIPFISKSLLPYTQQVAYHTVKLFTATSLLSFVTTILSNHSLGELVFRFEVELPCFSYGIIGDARDRIISMLKLLRRVESISIAGYPLLYDYIFSKEFTSDSTSLSTNYFSELRELNIHADDGSFTPSSSFPCLLKGISRLKTLKSFRLEVELKEQWNEFLLSTKDDLELISLDHIEQLHIRGPFDNPILLNLISSFSNITKLTLQDTSQASRLQLDFSPVLLKCTSTKLKELHLFDTIFKREFKDSSLLALCKFPQLEVLTIAISSFLPGNAFDKLKFLKCLKCVNLGYNIRDSETDLYWVVYHASKLTGKFDIPTTIGFKRLYQQKLLDSRWFDPRF